MPEYRLFEYYTEAMTVPFYGVAENQPLGEIAESWDMKPTHFLGPMTRVLAEDKPKPNLKYIVARIEEGRFAGTWGMIWSGHLRRARHRHEPAPGTATGPVTQAAHRGQEGVQPKGLSVHTGASYGYTANSLENVAMGQLTDLAGKVKPVPTETGPRCQLCKSPIRFHKIYETTECVELLRAVADWAKWSFLKKKPSGKYEAGETMLGVLMVYDLKTSKLLMIVGGESGWAGNIFQAAFGECVKSLYRGEYSYRWANQELDLMGGKKRDTFDYLNWQGEKRPGPAEAMQCAGPKLIQAYLRYDYVSNNRNIHIHFMSEIMARETGTTKMPGGVSYTYQEANSQVAKPTKHASLGFYGGKDPASSCMRCREEIPWMLCGKSSAIDKSKQRPAGTVIMHA
jgi:hypothetical protein